MAASTPTVSELIADYVVGLRFADLPAPVVDRAKELLLFNLGAAMRGRTLRAGKQAVQVSLDLSSGDRCSIVGENRRVALLDAVFANSALMDVVGIKDILEPSGTIPGSTVHPAALAVGEWTEAPGQRLLTAIVAGYDVMAKLHNGELDYGFAVPRPTKAVVEPFGVAAVAAHLLGLTREQTADAMGHAGGSVMASYEGGELMHPWASRNGVLAAMLARGGIPESRTIVEGPYGVYRTFFLQDVPDSVRANLATLGTDFEILKANTSPYPVSHANTMPIELTLRLAREHRITPDRIAEVHVVLPRDRETREAIYGVYPKGPSTLVAIALTDRRFDPARFEEELGDGVLAARERVQLRYEDGRGFFYCRLEISTTDGERHTAEGDGLRDGPPLRRSTWREVAGDDLDDAILSRLEGLVRNLEDVADVRELTTCLTEARAGGRVLT